MLYIDLRPGQTCHPEVMHRMEVTHSDGSYEEKSRRRTWLRKWDKVKIPWYTHRLMHRKRVTCELHDSYFRLMTIKHVIPKIEWAIELLYNSVKTGGSVSWRSDESETRCGRESHHPAESWPLSGLRLSSTGEKERHNIDGHKSGGQYIAVFVQSPTPSHTQTLQ